MTSPAPSVMTADAMPSMTFGKSLIQTGVPPDLSLATQSGEDAATTVLPNLVDGDRANARGERRVDAWRAWGRWQRSSKAAPFHRD